MPLPALAYRIAGKHARASEFKCARLTVTVAEEYRCAVCASKSPIIARSTKSVCLFAYTVYSDSCMSAAALRKSLHRNNRQVTSHKTKDRLDKKSNKDAGKDRRHAGRRRSSTPCAIPGVLRLFPRVPGNQEVDDAYVIYIASELAPNVA